MILSEPDRELCESSRWDFSDLRAVYINCTLKRSPEQSHTQGLMDRSIAVMEANNVAVKTFRLVDHQVVTGVWPDMTEHGWMRDEWPEIYESVSRRHRRGWDADLAGPNLIGMRPAHRAPLWTLQHAQRTRPVRLLRQGRRMHRDGERGRDQTLLDGRPLLAAACRVHRPAASRRRLDRRGSPGPSYLDESSGGPETTSPTGTPRS